MSRRGEEEPVTLSVVCELLEQQKTFYKELLEQQEKSYKSCLHILVDFTISRVDGLVKDISSISKDIQELKVSLQYTLADLDDLNANKEKSMEEIRALTESLTSPNIH